MTNHGRLAVREGVITEKQTVGTGGREYEYFSY